MKSFSQFGIGFDLAVAACVAAGVLFCGAANASTLPAKQTVSFSVSSPFQVYQQVLRFNREYHGEVNFRTTCLNPSVSRFNPMSQMTIRRVAANNPKARWDLIARDIANSCPGGTLILTAIPLPFAK